MSCNVGGIERSIRIVLGLVLLGIAIFGDLSTSALVMVSVVSGVALLTGAVGFCPAWKVMGINTCPAGTTEKR